MTATVTHERGDPEQTPDIPEIDQLLLNGDLSLGKKGGKEQGEKSRMREEVSSSWCWELGASCVTPLGSWRRFPVDLPCAPFADFALCPVL